MQKGPGKRGVSHRYKGRASPVDQSIALPCRDVVYDLKRRPDVLFVGQICSSRKALSPMACQSAVQLQLV
ncbi:hypothetical protein CHS0354_018662, partial [Potamilus streckersoni]